MFLSGWSDKENMFDPGKMIRKQLGVQAALSQQVGLVGLCLDGLQLVNVRPH